MALIKCPECGKKISDKAESCPECGCPASEFEKSLNMSEKNEERDITLTNKKSSLEENNVLNIKRTEENNSKKYHNKKIIIAGIVLIFAVVGILLILQMASIRKSDTDISTVAEEEDFGFAQYKKSQYTEQQGCATILNLCGQYNSKKHTIDDGQESSLEEKYLEYLDMVITNSNFSISCSAQEVKEFTDTYYNEIYVITNNFNKGENFDGVKYLNAYILEGIEDNSAKEIISYLLYHAYYDGVQSGIQEYFDIIKEQETKADAEYMCEKLQNFFDYFELDTDYSVEMEETKVVISEKGDNVSGRSSTSKKAEPKIGDSATDVKLSSWGSPNSINKTTTVNGVHEQWVYSNGRYIYLDDGVVTAIQE